MDNIDLVAIGIAPKVDLTSGDVAKGPVLGTLLQSVTDTSRRAIRDSVPFAPWLDYQGQRSLAVVMECNNRHSSWIAHLEPEIKGLQHKRDVRFPPIADIPA